ncbi:MULTISPECIES: hypothetical protein [unclassified Thermosynechococcus]|uniref:hypothetical protein n=1 Tax=unclassified Thermosynechococcus TaxID=2622553 RepID=UPI0019E872DC|nr:MULTISPECIES: hypothetical protein [unclassified Thermosynechococcus]HIK35566.1 hypothetical protein [Thermosynechococcus sp. M98_K2018_005]
MPTSTNLPVDSLMFSLECPANSLEQAIGHLSPVEQIRMLMHHPYFTGRCPVCRQPIHHSQIKIDQCHCSHCGWQDQVGDREVDLTLENPLPSQN